MPSQLRATRFAIIFLALLPVAYAVASDDATPWVQVANSDGVVICSRKRAGSAIEEFQSVGRIEAPSRAVFAVLNDPAAYPTFMPYTVECRVLQHTREGLVTYQRLDPPLIDDRDYTVLSEHTETPGPVGPTYRIHWHLANDLGPAQVPGVQRVQTCRGSWLLEPTASGATRATYTIYSGTGGSIPAFLANRGSRVAIRKVFDAVRKEALKPKYAEAKN